MKFARIIAAGALMMMLSSCFLQPGKFTSAMSVMKDGSFSFSYTGEIHLFTYKKMMEEMMKERSGYDIGEFDAENTRCWDDQPVTDAAVSASENVIDAATYEGRECTKEELVQRKKDWDEEREGAIKRAEQNNKDMAEMLGGIDLNDPKTLDEFARRLQGQEGWKTVVHKGEGVFEVDYELSGRLTHDFVFPIYTGFKYIIPFVQMTRRDDGRVFIIAPAFVGAGQNDGTGMSMTAAMAGMGAGTMGGPSIANGTFTLTTDAEILTNNTQDGPAKDGSKKVLSWIVGPLDNKVPEALLQL